MHFLAQVACHNGKKDITSMSSIIILTDKLPPSQKQRFRPALKQEEAEKLLNALEKEGIISNWVGDWVTNVVLVSKKADPANKAIEQPLLDQILDTTLPGPPKAKLRPTSYKLSHKSRRSHVRIHEIHVYATCRQKCQIIL